MKKIKILRALVVLFALCFSLSLFSKIELTAKASPVQLAEGNHQNWIDRLDLTDAVYARDFYDWLVENTDNDGEEDALIEFSQEEHLVCVIEGSITLDASDDNYAQNIKDELKVISDENFEEVADCISLVYSAFNRDYNEVFWLKREVRTASSMSYDYYNTGLVEYEQKVFFVIKDIDDETNVVNFDARLSVYADGTLDIKTAIDEVDNAINSILIGVEQDASRYEKVKYFNKWLTKNNCYAKTITENSRDARGALLGQKGTSQYAPVCEGYARAFKILCDRADIPCVLTSGDAEGEAHMWNLVQMENGNWYAVDTTWNDPSVSGDYSQNSGYETENYLLVGKKTKIGGKEFSLSHTETNVTYEDSIAMNNGPQQAEENYGAPVKVSSWDVSKGVATLYQAEGYLPANPVYKLIISGNGAVIDYNNTNDCPWKLYANYIEEIEIRAGVSIINGVAFGDCSNLSVITVNGNLTFGDEVFFVNTNCVFSTHTNYDCYQKAQSLGFQMKSICTASDWTVIQEQGCEQDEIKKGVCLCGKEIIVTGELAHGHDYLDWTIEKQPTLLSTGKIIRVCSHDNEHIETFELPVLNKEDYTYSVITPAKCEEIGLGEYVYEKDGQEIVIQVNIQPIGHDFAEPTYEWDYLKMKCTARRVCRNDASHVEIEEGNVTASKEVNCQTSGKIEFTATFENSAFTTQVEEQTLTPQPHEFSDEYVYDKDKHWKECKNCTQRKDEAEHSFSEWQIIKEPTLIFEGTRERRCECGYIETESIEKVDFIEAIKSGNIKGDVAFVLIVGGTVLGIAFLSILIKAITKKKK